MGYHRPVESRCYFVASDRTGQDGQYQWWNLRARGEWVCDMWMNVEDGAMRHGRDSREDETSVSPSYFEGNRGLVRVW